MSCQRIRSLRQKMQNGPPPPPNSASRRCLLLFPPHIVTADRVCFSYRCSFWSDKEPRHPKELPGSNLCPVQTETFYTLVDFLRILCQGGYRGPALAQIFPPTQYHSRLGRADPLPGSRGEKKTASVSNCNLFSESGSTHYLPSL